MISVENGLVLCLDQCTTLSLVLSHPVLDDSLRGDISFVLEVICVSSFTLSHESENYFSESYVLKFSRTTIKHHVLHTDSNTSCAQYIPYSNGSNVHSYQFILEEVQLFIVLEQCESSSVSFPTHVRRIRDEDGNPLLPPAGGTHGALSSSPTHTSHTLPTPGHAAISFPKANTLGWSLTDHTKPRKGKGDAPTVPPRSLESLGLRECLIVHLCVVLCPAVSTCSTSIPTLSTSLCCTPICAVVFRCRASNNIVCLRDREREREIYTVCDFRLCHVLLHACIVSAA